MSDDLVVFPPASAGIFSLRRQNSVQDDSQMEMDLLRNSPFAEGIACKEEPERSTQQNTVDNPFRDSFDR
jgi:hypothetical protein